MRVAFGSNGDSGIWFFLEGVRCDGHGAKGRRLRHHDHGEKSGCGVDRVKRRGVSGDVVAVLVIWMASHLDTGGLWVRDR
jgi:hypothetical protein